MADFTPVAQNFDGGFMSDIPRDQLPKGVSYRYKDYIPNLGTSARKRGGWTYASRDLNALSAISRIVAMGWAPFSDISQLVAISDNGKSFYVRRFDGTNVSDAGTLIASSGPPVGMTSNPFWHKDRLILPVARTVDAAPVKYENTAPATYLMSNIGGTPPRFSCGASWGSWLIGANGFITAVRYPNRVWWSNIGNADAWTPADSNYDAPEEIIGIVAKNNVIMLFGYTGVHLLLGTIPPPGGDLTARPFFFQQGCFDPKSIATHREYTIWANNSGVWRTDGSNLTDLTEKGGISQYWQNLVSTFSGFDGWTAAGGIYRGCYFISLCLANVPVATLVCDLDRMVWWEFTNLGTLTFASRPAAPGTAVAKGFEELFAAPLPGTGFARRVANISPLWNPSSANASDADGTAVLPSLETPFYRMGTMGYKRFRRLMVDYEMSSAGSPTLQVAYTDAPESSSYTVMGTLAKRAKLARKPSLRIGKRLLGVGLRLNQTAASDDTRLTAIELEGHPLETGH